MVPGPHWGWMTPATPCPLSPGDKQPCPGGPRESFWLKQHLVPPHPLLPHLCPCSAYTTRISTGLQVALHTAGMLDKAPPKSRPLAREQWGVLRRWHQDTAQAWLEGTIGVMPCPCSLFSPPSFRISIKVCSVNAAGVVGPAPAGHMDWGEGGGGGREQMRKWSGTGVGVMTGTSNTPACSSSWGLDPFPTEERMERFRGLPLRMFLTADVGKAEPWGQRRGSLPGCTGCRAPEPQHACALQATPALLSALTWSTASVAQENPCLAVCPRCPWLAPGPLPGVWLAARDSWQPLPTPRALRPDSACPAALVHLSASTVQLLLY